MIVSGFLTSILYQLLSLDRMLVEGDGVDGTETQGESEGRRNRAEVSKPTYASGWR